jgi:hypothetical protein
MFIHGLNGGRLNTFVLSSPTKCFYMTIIFNVPTYQLSTLSLGQVNEKSQLIL